MHGTQGRPGYCRLLLERQLTCIKSRTSHACEKSGVHRSRRTDGTHHISLFVNRNSLQLTAGRVGVCQKKQQLSFNPQSRSRRPLGVRLMNLGKPYRHPGTRGASPDRGLADQAQLESENCVGTLMALTEVTMLRRAWQSTL